MPDAQYHHCLAYKPGLHDPLSFPALTGIKRPPLSNQGAVVRWLTRQKKVNLRLLAYSPETGKSTKDWPLAESYFTHEGGVYKVQWAHFLKMEPGTPILFFYRGWESFRNHEGVTIGPAEQGFVDIKTGGVKTRKELQCVIPIPSMRNATLWQRLA